MSDSTPGRLPRGRHGLSREQVAADQRVRILFALAEAMAEKGYVATSVADVLKRAGVSRETFYQQFSSKQDAFMAAFDAAGVMALDSVRGGEVLDGTPLERFDAALGVYLDNLARHPAFARMFLIEVHAAGDEAIARRAAFQTGVVDAMVEQLGLGDEQRFACEVIVAATSSLVTPLLVSGDLDAVRGLRTPIVEALRRLIAVDEGDHHR